MPISSGANGWPNQYRRWPVGQPDPKPKVVVLESRPQTKTVIHRDESPQRPQVIEEHIYKDGRPRSRSYSPTRRSRPSTPERRYVVDDPPNRPIERHIYEDRTPKDKTPRPIEKHIYEHGNPNGRNSRPVERHIYDHGGNRPAKETHVYAPRHYNNGPKDKFTYAREAPQNRGTGCFGGNAPKNGNYYRNGTNYDSGPTCCNAGSRYGGKVNSLKNYISISNKMMIVKFVINFIFKIIECCCSWKVRSYRKWL